MIATRLSQSLEGKAKRNGGPSKPRPTTPKPKRKKKKDEKAVRELERQTAQTGIDHYVTATQELNRLGLANCHLCIDGEDELYPTGPKAGHGMSWNKAMYPVWQECHGFEKNSAQVN